MRSAPTKCGAPSRANEPRYARTKYMSASRCSAVRAAASGGGGRELGERRAARPHRAPRPLDGTPSPAFNDFLWSRASPALVPRARRRSPCTSSPMVRVGRRFGSWRQRPPRDVGAETPSLFRCAPRRDRSSADCLRRAPAYNCSCDGAARRYRWPCEASRRLNRAAISEYQRAPPSGRTPTLRGGHIFARARLAPNRRHATMSHATQGPSAADRAARAARGRRGAGDGFPTGRLCL